MQAPQHDGVIIPIRGSQEAECVHLLPEDLPDMNDSAGVDAILQILQAEFALPNVWADLAEAYYRKGRPDIFREVLRLLLEGLLEDGVKEEMEGHTEAQKRQFAMGLLRVYNMLGAQATLEAIKCKHAEDEQRRMELWDTAKRDFDLADTVVQYAEPTLLNKGWMALNLSAGATWKHANYLFNNAITEARNRGGHNLLAMLGLAIHAYHMKTPEELRRARKLFGEVIRRYPGCPAEVRVGFGLCCYRLGETDRAKAAFQRALTLNRGNRLALLALARAELSDAKLEEYPTTLDRVVKMQTAAYVQGDKDPLAMVSLATYYLHKWFPLPADALKVADGSEKVTVGASEGANGRLVDFERGDLIRVGPVFTARVLEVVEKEVDGEEKSGPAVVTTTLTLDRPFHGRGVATEAETEDGQPPHYPRLALYRKDFKRAMSLLDSVLGRPEELCPNDLRGEALYLKARVVHQLDDFESARTYYQQACQICPDLAPAQYGYAQMLAAQSRTLTLRDRKQEAAARLREAVLALNRVLDRVPNDPEALTLLGLLLAEQHQDAPDKSEALEKLRRAVDLRPDVKETWVALGQVYQREPGPDLKEALRCQLKAEDLILRHQEPVPAALLSNIGALFHVKGEQRAARGYYRRALEAFATTGGTGLGDLEAQYLPEEQQIRHESNAVFWRWEDVNGMTVELETGSRRAAVVGNGADGLSGLKPGEHLKFRLGQGRREGFVSEVAAEGEEGGEEDRTSGDLLLKHAYFLPAPPGPVHVARKHSRGLLRQETLTTVFNLAMVHQEMGEFSAAEELYLAISKQYPSYAAAYVKLGLLAQSQGRGPEALMWLGKARSLAPQDREVAAICGKVEQDLGRRDQAQRLFEPLNKEGDPYAMVALGNLYFMNSITVPDKAHHIGHARVYHTKVLKKEPKNLYAAHGLGLVLAEEFGKVDDARAVLQAVRERSGDKPDEILINIGHMFVAQGQRSAAIHCYEAFLKKRPLAADGLYVRVLEFMAHAHFLGRGWEKALRAIAKGFHLEPTKASLAFNVGLVLDASVSEAFKRANALVTTSVEESRGAQRDLLVAIDMLSRSELASTYAKVKKKVDYLKANQSLARQYVQAEGKRFREDEENKARQAALVAAEMRRRDEVKRVEEEEREKEREAARHAALQRDEELRRLTSQWAQEPKEAPKSSKKGAGRKSGEILSEGEEEEGSDGGEGRKRPKKHVGSDDGNDDDEDEEGGGSAHIPPQLASSSEGSSSDDSSDDEAYGVRPAEPSKRREEGKEGAFASPMEEGDGTGGNGDGDGEDGEESRKRKGEEGGGGGPKKRRLQRAQQSDDSGSDEEDELFGISSKPTPAATATFEMPASDPLRAAMAPSSPALSVALAGPPSAGSGEEGGQGARELIASPSAVTGRRKVMADEDDEGDE
ncbi:rna polymerase-associated protein ctr9 homolog [Nannochloropsis oceanica]